MKRIKHTMYSVHSVSWYTFTIFIIIFERRREKGGEENFKHFPRLILRIKNEYIFEQSSSLILLNAI